jgi:hypothetical protein
VRGSDTLSVARRLIVERGHFSLIWLKQSMRENRNLGYKTIILFFALLIHKVIDGLVKTLVLKILAGIIQYKQIKRYIS